jgi:hypothetical protein
MSVQYETVTLIVEYDSETETRPEKWDWQGLTGNRMLVIEAFRTDDFELRQFQGIYEPDKILE